MTYTTTGTLTANPSTFLLWTRRDSDGYTCVREAATELVEHAGWEALGILSDLNIRDMENAAPIADA